jgi:hypothetical protein
MKLFYYIARMQDGTQTRGEIRALDRLEALRILKEKGLVPISVIVRKPSEDKFSSSWFARNYILIIVISVIIILLIWFGLGNYPRTKENKKIISTKKRVENKVSVTNVNELNSVVKENIIVESVTRTNNVASLNQQPTIKIIEINSGSRTNPVQVGLSSGAERVLNMVFSSKLGAPPPPIFQIPFKESTNLIEILKRDIIVYDDDTQATIEWKENLAYAKNLLKEYIQQGGEVENFITYYQNELAKAFYERQELQQLYSELLKAGNTEMSDQYFTLANEELAKKGYLPLSRRPTKKEKK